MASKKPYIYLLAILTFLLSACATNAQKQYDYMASQFRHAESENELCVSGYRNKGAYQRLDQILIMEPNEPEAVRKMTIERYANQNEKDDLLTLNREFSTCRKQALENLGKVHPDLVTLVAGFYAENDGLTLDLIKDKIKISEYNEILNKRDAKRKEQWNSVSNSIMQQLQNSHQSEVEARQRSSAASTAALQQWNYQQQMINSINRPTTTNCHSTGNIINCTSY